MNPWLQVLLSLGAGLITASGALLGVRFTVRGNDRATEQRDVASLRETEQRELAARREEWWRRFMWAAELTWDESKRKRVVGLQLITKLAESELAGKDDCLLLDAFQERLLKGLEEDDTNEEEQAAS